jgi:NAD(P)-dependent dehydrogenase (short-subunit alcohol dehydrogenase family)
VCAKKWPGPGADELGGLALTADLTDLASLPGLWQAAVEWRGRVDALVNNAGIYEPADPAGPLDAWTAAWERTLAKASRTSCSTTAPPAAAMVRAGRRR